MYFIAYYILLITHYPFYIFLMVAKESIQFIQIHIQI